MMRRHRAVLLGIVLTHATCAAYATHATHAAHRTFQVQTAAEPGTFTFRDGRSRVFDLTVTDTDGVAGIVWPELGDARWDSALLGVQITADAAAALPYVEIAAGGVSDRQYFPPGDVGERWLNLTFLRGAIVGT